MSSIRMKLWERMPKSLKVVVWMVLGIVAFIALALVFGWVVQFLWNTTVADMFGWSEISYWQAIGIFLLAKFLFGFGIGGSNKSAASKKKAEPKSVNTAADARADAETGSENLSDLVENADFRKFWAAEGRAAWNTFRRGA